MLADFIADNREAIVTRYQSKCAIAPPSTAPDAGRAYAALVFIEELLDSMRDQKHRTPMRHRGDTVLEERLIVPRAIQCRDICQSIAELAMEMNMPIDVADFANLDRCCDDAVAHAITECVSHRNRMAQGSVAAGSERLHGLQHKVRQLVDAALLSFDVLRTGTVGLDGTTGRLLYRSLIEIRSLANPIDRDKH